MTNFALTYRFRGFILDVGRGRLQRDGDELVMRPKSLALLVFLVRNADRLLSKEEIIDTIWPNVFVTENSLTQCIRDIRRILGDTDQSLIKTVPRRGYILLGTAFDPPIVYSPDQDRHAREALGGSRPDDKSVLELCNEGRVPVPNSWLT